MVRPLTTVYVSIGNSDNKLTQERWSQLCHRTFNFLRGEAAHVHGVWFSAPDSPYQNAAICFEIDAEQQAEPIKDVLRQIAELYDQDSIAWAVAETEFVTPRV
jgi:hypothetical protein